MLSSEEAQRPIGPRGCVLACDEESTTSRVPSTHAPPLHDQRRKCRPNGPVHVADPNSSFVRGPLLPRPQRTRAQRHGHTIPRCTHDVSDDPLTQRQFAEGLRDDEEDHSRALQHQKGEQKEGHKRGTLFQEEVCGLHPSMGGGHIQAKINL